MAQHTLIVERNDALMEIADGAPETLRPGDTLIIQLRDYTPPDEVEDADRRSDEDGSTFCIDALHSIRCLDAAPALGLPSPEPTSQPPTALTPIDTFLAQRNPALSDQPRQSQPRAVAAHLRELGITEIAVDYNNYPSQRDAIEADYLIARLPNDARIAFNVLYYLAGLGMTVRYESLASDLITGPVLRAFWPLP